MASPTILAVDTTAEIGTVAVRRGGETAAEIHLRSLDGFGHVIFRAIKEVVAGASIKLQQIDCFVAASGPGSFTGVRVGLAAIKGLAAALGKPAAGVSNLRALSLFGHGPLRAAVLDARRGEIYGAVYDSQARIVVPESVAAWAAWVMALPDGSELVGFEDGPCSWAGVTFHAAPKGMAAAAAQCAEMDGEAAWQDPALLDANYVRRSDAELFWKEA